MTAHRTDACARCRKAKPIHARRLCISCYRFLDREGGLEQYPVRPRRSIAEAAALIDEFKALGLKDEAIALRFGYKNAGVVTGLRWRARHEVTR